MSAPTLEQLLERLGRLGGSVALPNEQHVLFIEFVGRLEKLAASGHLTREGLGSLVENEPNYVPALALCVRLSQEQLKNSLKNELGTAGWLKLARTRPLELVDMLDREYGLIDEVTTQLDRTWSFSDVLEERFAPRLKASGAIGRGRSLEDEVEQIVESLGLPRQMRTRFIGRGGESAPCDVAIPAGGSEAHIVVGIKAFDSTGSKLTAAADEVQIMATARKPTQFVFVVLDGIGWKNRLSDLRKIHQRWANDEIDGVYTKADLPQFAIDLEDAARQRKLMD
jgi:hypothetical protein